MIKAQFQRDSKGRLFAFACTGHAGYAESGHDIVCAAVSAITGTCIGSLQDLTEAQPEYRIDAERGEIFCQVLYPQNPSAGEAIKLLMESCLLGLRQVELTYGSYITLSVREV